MTSTPNQNSEPIAFEWPAFTEEHISQFEKATGSSATAGEPPTLCTILRWGEFQWLDRLHVDMRRLLHTEQEYEYVSPVRAGEKHQVVTALTNHRERRGMVFVTMESTVKSGDEVRLKARTHFVLRPEEGATK